MSQWHIEKGCAWMSAHFSADLISSLGVNTVQCSLPWLMESHSAGPLRQANWGSFYLSLHYNMLWSQICQREERTRIYSSRIRVLDSGYAVKRWVFLMLYSLHWNYNLQFLELADLGQIYKQLHQCIRSSVNWMSALQQQWDVLQCSIMCWSH